MQHTDYNTMVKLANRSIIILVTMAVAACATSASDRDPAEHRPSTGGIMTNGLDLNGLDLNGLDLNGLDDNGLRLNGLDLNGLDLNGLDLNGLDLNGLDLNGLDLNGLDLNGLDLNGLSITGIRIHGNNTAIGTSAAGTQGRSLRKVAINGFDLDGIGFNGITVGGIPLLKSALAGVDGQSLAMNGAGVSGIRINHPGDPNSQLTGLTLNRTKLGHLGNDGAGMRGRGFDGLNLNGLYLTGTATGTLVVAGTSIENTALDGLAINGSSNNGLRVLASDGRVATFSAQQRAALDDTLFYLVGCALPRHGSVTIITVDGKSMVYKGLRGFAPEWQYGPISQAGAEKVRSCLISSRAAYAQAPLTALEQGALETVLTHLVGCALPRGQSITVLAADGTPKNFAGLRGFAPEWQFGALSQAGSESVRACLDSAKSGDTLGLNPEQEEQFLSLFHYLTQCALAPEQSVSITSSAGIVLHFPGALGLAPEWASGPLSSIGQRLVSACLAARTNANGQTVHISIRGAGIATTPVERSVYEQQEGAFWGNFFGSNPHISTCKADGAGISGRVCTEDGCGFTNAGSCADICATKDAVDGHYTDCAGDDAVINIFLSITDDVAFGKDHSCFRQDDGSLWCWGENTHGKLGDGSETSRLAPAPVTALGKGVDEVAAGANHTCARKDDGSVWCWGENNEGQLGSASLASQALDPEQVSVIGNDVASLAVGSQHACGLKTDGSLWCWGDNFYGQLGDSTTTSQNAPVQVESLGMDVAAVSLGDCAQHTCALTNEGAAWCWGWNDAGQLGNGTVQTSALPARVTHDSLGNEFTDVTDLCTGWMHTCARKADGSVWCWGSNDRGRLGNSHLTSTIETQPVRVALTGEVVQGGLTCAMDHSCAIKTDGSVWCWGGNEHGQLGNGTITPASPAASAGSPTPGQVIGLPAAAVRVSADSSHTCATLADSSLYCWGQNNNNLIYDGPSSATPVLFDMPSFDTYAPAGVSVSFGVATADLRWAAHQAAGLAHYEIVRNGQLVQIVAAGSQHALDSNLGAGTYCYQLRAVLTDGTASAFSQEICGAID